MRKNTFITALSLSALLIGSADLNAAELIPAPGSKKAEQKNIIITKAEASAERVGDSIPVSAIGEPVSGVTLSTPKWVDRGSAEASYAVVEGAILPVDPKAKPINFRVILPASWSRRAVQQGGAGINGTITANERGISQYPGFAVYGSDSGHQVSGFGGFGGGGASNDEWALNDEVIQNFGYMQMKKTHDAAMVIMERVYGEKPTFNYYIGGSQGGREALTVAQRYPADYDGIIADVPVVNFSSLMLAPELIRIQEKPLKNWVTPAKANAIRAEFMRQCDKLDGLEDGIINNYVAARQLFDVTDGIGTTEPWSALRAPNGVDPNPEDSSAAAKLSDGQIETLEMVYSRYTFATPLDNGVKTFGMWVPNTDVSGSGLIESTRFKGQEGAPENARVHSHLGVLGVTGFLMQDLSANPLDYVEGGKYNARREQISKWLDSTNPDLSAFYKRGGKMIVTIGTNDSLASPGAQLDYYQSVIDKLGQDEVDAFARFFVLPQTGHGLSGNIFATNGSGEKTQGGAIPNQFDKLKILRDWVEKNEAPEKTLVVTAGNRSLPLCSYPNYPKYIGGPLNEASSYKSTTP
ncbi:MAG: tannase/feruloyl esterase family alpha/beta hydrolase [Pontiellaceae bacterium]|nr:tannase/feruloyl esterase family alpha/beta hydrolase [Pontiellaceae bacterium]